MSVIVGKVRAFCVVVLAFAFTFSAFAVDISTPDDFVEKMTTNPSGNYRLTADIDLTGTTFNSVPIFNGTLDGGGHVLSGVGDQPFCRELHGVITNLVFDGSGLVRAGTGIGGLGDTCLGGKVIDVTVRNLTLNHASYNKGVGNGAFFATVYDGSSLIRCTADSTCTLGYLKGQHNNSIGGLVGMIKFKYDKVEDIFFIDCVNKATLSSNGHANSGHGAGGIVGLISAGRGTVTHIVFRGCENRGIFTVSGDNGHFGGIVGYSSSTSVKSEGVRLYFIDCANYSNATVTGVFGGVGGILGRGSGCSSFEMDGCVNYGNIGGAKASWAGGLCGYIGEYISSVTGLDTVEFRNCANYGNITGKTTAGGIAGSADTNIGWATGKFYVLNCATYGTVSGAATLGQVLGLLVTQRSCTIDNCFSPAGTIYNKSSASGAKAATVTNCKTPDDASALADLNTVAASTDGYVPWVSGATYPELSIFNASVQSSYPVVFRDIYGAVVKIESVVAGGSATEPEGPSRVGYIFKKWDKSVTNVTAPLTVYPEYTPERHVISFDTRGGCAVASITNYTGEVVIYDNPPTKDGFVFKGWSFDKAEIKELPNLMPPEDQTYYAIWYPQGGGKDIHTKMNLLLWDLHSPTPMYATTPHLVELHGVMGDKSVSVCSFYSANGYHSLYPPEGWADRYMSGQGGTDGSWRHAMINGKVFTMLSSAFLGTASNNGSSCTTSHVAFEDGNGTQFVLLSAHFYHAYTTIDKYLTSLGDLVTKLRSQYPGAFFIFTAKYTNFASATDYATTWESSLTKIADKITELTGFHQLQVGDDCYWIMTELVPTKVSVEKIINATVSSDPGYVASLEFGTSAQYTVRFLDWNDAVLKSEQVFEGEDATPPDDPYRKGYTFTGWDGNWTNVQKNEDVKATYKEGETTLYRVRFLDWDDTVLSDKKVAAGTAAVPPPDPVREGYDFVGWDQPYDHIIAAVDIRAKYVKHTVPTVYVSPDGVNAYGRGQLNRPYLTVRYAIDSLGSAGGEVRMLPGVYVTSYQTEIATPIKLCKAYADSEVICRNTGSPTWDNSYCRLFLLNNADAVISGLIFEDGKSYAYGSAVYVTSGRVEQCLARNCKITSSKNTDVPRGAICVRGSESYAVGCVVTNCTCIKMTDHWSWSDQYLQSPGMFAFDGGTLENCLVKDCCVESWTAEYYGVKSKEDSTPVKRSTAAGAIGLYNGGKALNCTAIHCRGSYPGIAAFNSSVIVNCVAFDCYEGHKGEPDVLAGIALKSASMAYNSAVQTECDPEWTHCVGKITSSDFLDYSAELYAPKPLGALYNNGSNDLGSKSSVDLIGNKRVVKVIDIGALESQFVPGFIITGRRID